MNLDLIMEIAQLALSLLENGPHGTQTAAEDTNTLLLILQKGVLAYEQQTGQALDPKLIHTEAAV